MSRFLEALHSGRVLLMDGAMGTELQRAGLGEGECGELWNLEKPHKVRAIHQAYADAGAECFLTNTFQANRIALERRGLHDHQEAINAAGYELARSVVGDERFVLVDIGPIVDPSPARAWEFDLHEISHHAIPVFDHADGLLIETGSDPGALDAANCLAIGELIPVVPILLSLSYMRDASGILQTRSGHPPEWFASNAPALGVASALGVNCGKDIGMKEMVEIIRRYRAVTDLPLFARPNAGTPKRVDGRWVYPRTPEAMAAELPELLEAGVSMVGGCCGTTPAHIAAFRPIVEGWNKRRA